MELQRHDAALGDARDDAGTGPLTTASSSPTELLARARHGDDQAFAMLVAEWYPRALRFARHMLGDARDAEEAVQDAWLRVHSAFPRFDEAQPFAPWFFRILANRCRTVGARIQRDPVVMLDDELPDIAAPEPTPPLEFPAHVSRALRQLPLEQREAFLLRHVEDHSYEAIAAAAGIGVSAARMRVKRAADTLRDLLQEALRA